MDSMRDIQERMMKGCRWDGGYPKVIHVGMGIICRVDSKAEEDAVYKQTLYGNLIAITLVIIGGFLAWYFYL